MILSRFAWPLAGAALFAAVIGVEEWRIAGLQRHIAQEKQARSDDRAVMERAARTAEGVARDEEARRADALRRITDESEKNLVIARAAIADADAARGRLQQRVAALAAAPRRCPAHPTTPGASAPAASTADLYSDVLRGLGEFSGQLARAADERGAAGAACVKSYEALTP